MTHSPIVDWTSDVASPTPEPSAVGDANFTGVIAPEFAMPAVAMPAVAEPAVAEPAVASPVVSRRESLAPEKTKKRKGSILRRVISVVIVLIALVIFWPAQYGGVTGLTVVNGHSMEPLYHTGDLVISLKQPAYHVGDIISYVVPTGQDGAGGRVIHRITSIDTSSGAPVFSTTGDNNGGRADPWHAGPKDVMGKALFMIPGFGGIIGGMSNPLLIGLICGVLVTVVLWSSDAKDKPSNGRPSKKKRSVGEVARDR